MPKIRKQPLAEPAYRKGVRLALTISPQASEMINQLLATGLFGVHGRASVAQELIYRGLRQPNMHDLLALINLEKRRLPTPTSKKRA